MISANYKIRAITDYLTNYLENKRLKDVELSSDLEELKQQYIDIVPVIF